MFCNRNKMIDIWYVTTFRHAYCTIPAARDKYNLIKTSDNDERIFLNKNKIFLYLAFGQVGEKKIR
jgi:hypothetical protein